MMKALITLLVFLFISYQLVADTTSTNRRLSDLEHIVKRIDNNQLNYKIEKDLLKETYSNIYETISLVITLILGVLGVLGYIGLKDISGIKKEYEQELSNLRNIQNQFNLKTTELDQNKANLEKELKSIIEENEAQSRKIKFIEIKERVRKLVKEESIPSALEFCNAGLEIVPEDPFLLDHKARILCRLDQLKDARDIYLAALKLHPTDKTIILNTVECLYFVKDITSAKKIIDENSTLFQEKADGMLMKFFEILELYFNENKEGLEEIIKSLVKGEDLKVTKKVVGWGFKEAQYFAHYQMDGPLKLILQNIIWYFDGQINGEQLLNRLKIEKPK